VYVRGYIPHGGQEAGREGTRYNLQRPPSYLLPPTRLYLLKFAALPKIAPPAGTKCSAHELMVETSYSNRNGMGGGTGRHRKGERGKKREGGRRRGRKREGERREGGKRGVGRET
jgi:hypothetical protein